MRNARPFRWSKREAEAGDRLGGQTTAMPADDELVRRRIGACRGLEHRRFHLGNSMQRRPGYRPAQDLFEPVHLGAMSELTAKRHERVCEVDGGLAAEGTWQVGHGARTHPPPENVGLKRRVGVDLDQPAGVVHPSAVGRHRPRRVDAALVHPRLAEEGDAAVGKPQQTSHRPIVAGVDRVLQLGDIGERSYRNPVFEGLPDARRDATCWRSQATCLTSRPASCSGPGGPRPCSAGTSCSDGTDVSAQRRMPGCDGAPFDLRPGASNPRDSGLPDSARPIVHPADSREIGQHVGEAIAAEMPRLRAGERVGVPDVMAATAFCCCTLDLLIEIRTPSRRPFPQGERFQAGTSTGPARWASVLPRRAPLRTARTGPSTTRTCSIGCASRRRSRRLDIGPCTSRRSGSPGSPRPPAARDTAPGSARSLRGPP